MVLCRFVSYRMFGTQEEEGNWASVLDMRRAISICGELTCLLPDLCIPLFDSSWLFDVFGATFVAFVNFTTFPKL